ncbi:MAG: aminoglycoside phosphotransferase family protein [Caldilineaceae bacterium]
MNVDLHFAHIFSQYLDEQIAAIHPLGVAYGSNRVYQVETTSGQRYVLKQPKPVREDCSPFWQQMDALFGINSTTQISVLPAIAAHLQQQPIIPIPHVIHVEPNAADPEQSYALVTHLAGVAHEPDAFPASEALHEQLGHYVGYLHTQSYHGYGNLLMPALQPQAHFFAAMVGQMRRIIREFWGNEPALQEQLERLTIATTQEAIFSSAALIMTDISANQFVYHNQQIAGVVDLDAYVIGPCEWELAMLEMSLTVPMAFRRGYEDYGKLPPFAPFRAFYRLWSYLNDPDDGYDATQFADFMERSQYFA